WPVVAEHAAEALAALRRTETVPALLTLLDAPDPQATYSRGNAPTVYVKELVRVNHKINCLMCHPASFNTADPLRTPRPPLRVQLGGLGGGYFGPPPKATKTPQQKETFVRADVTYLRQDYSVMLQGRRYDLFVRERPGTPADAAEALTRKTRGPTEHQKAAAF